MNCFIDYRTTLEEIENLHKLNLNPIIVPKNNNLYEAINGHVDIQLNIINKKSRTVIIEKSISHNFIKNLEHNNIKYIFSQKELKNTYPDNIFLNALILKDYFIHNIKYTDENLLKNMQNKKIINVKQGYTKCSVLPIRDNAIITSDKGIYNSLKNENLDILLLPPKDILLPSLDYGFIGGAGGMINENTLALFGELNNYKYGDEVYKFLYKYDVKPVSLRKGKLIDRGSLLCI